MAPRSVNLNGFMLCYNEFNWNTLHCFLKSLYRVQYCLGIDNLVKIIHHVNVKLNLVNLSIFRSLVLIKQVYPNHRFYFLTKFRCIKAQVDLQKKKKKKTEVDPSIQWVRWCKSVTLFPSSPFLFPLGSRHEL
jgi:hypothetical protein